jgi:hypothetical protein
LKFSVYDFLNKHLDGNLNPKALFHFSDLDSFFKPRREAHPCLIIALH